MVLATHNAVPSGGLTTAVCSARDQSDRERLRDLKRAIDVEIGEPRADSVLNPSTLLSAPSLAEGRGCSSCTQQREQMSQNCSDSSGSIMRCRRRLMQKSVWALIVVSHRSLSWCWRTESVRQSESDLAGGPGLWERRHLNVLRISVARREDN